MFFIHRVHKDVLILSWNMTGHASLFKATNSTTSFFYVSSLLRFNPCKISLPCYSVMIWKIWVKDVGTKIYTLTPIWHIMWKLLSNLAKLMWMCEMPHFKWVFHSKLKVNLTILKFLKEQKPITRMLTSSCRSTIGKSNAKVGAVLSPLNPPISCLLSWQGFTTSE